MTKAELERVAGELRRWVAEGGFDPSQATLDLIYFPTCVGEPTWCAEDREIDLHILSVAEAVEQGCWP